MIKFSHYSSLYLEFKEHELKPSTYYKYQNIVSARILPYFQDREINTIKPSDIKKWLYNIEDVGAKSKKHYIGVLSGIFQEALYDDVISKNPVKQIRIPKYEKPTITPFTADEVYRILNHAKNYNYKHYLAIAFYTGMRSGEIIALKKTDIDFHRRLISVSRSRGIFGESTPKTKYSIRQIPIIDSLLPYLQDIYNHHDYDYLFINQYKRPYRDNNVFTYKFWQPSLKELNIEYRRPYNTRHTYATNMLYNQLVSPVQLAQLLGHANTQMVYDVYVNYLEKQFDNFDNSIVVYK
ncbi:Phage integrase [hydrothermal vent metagenome]|uniref:Phage integrase n=1 Tax=hydrothermal vent metagenome TaxID=652676 RepID=A0A1W1BN14_9ZZZZ